MARINIYSVKQVKESGGLYDVNTKCLCPDDAYTIINKVLNLSDESCEKFGIINLNVKNRVTGIHIIAIGSLSQALVHPREVFKAAILNNSASIILFHNHPSGDPTPSEEDIVLTKRLCEIGELMGIEVMDHIVIGDERFYSLKNQGVI